MYNITVQQQDNQIILSAPPHERLIDVLNQNKIYLDAPCGRKCLCGKCKLYIKDSVASEQERRFMTDTEYKNGCRLACAVSIKSDLSIIIPENTTALIQTGGIRRPFSGNKTGLGIAVDVGTTTLAMYLIDLKNGVILNHHSDINKQKSYGADVISRITYCIEHEDGTATLQNVILSQLDEMILALAHNNNIEEVVIAGNTVMEHIILGKNPIGLAVSPFTPVFLSGQTHNSKQLGFHTDFLLKLMPCISPYIGGDISASILACSMDLTHKTVLLIDIGTNGEMVLVKNGTYFCCSVAAGPAFEGNHITCGTGSIQGAINKISLSHGMIHLETIAAQPSIGICGSGLIDLIAHLLNERIIDDTGLIQNKLLQKPEWRRYISADHTEFRITPNIKLTQSDIRTLQLAKSAILSGIRTLVHAADTAYNEIDTVYLSGGFGSFIDQTNAVIIGLLPAELADKIQVAGNTSGSGAISALCNSHLFDTAETIRKHAVMIELADSEEFSSCYLKNMGFRIN